MLALRFWSMREMKESHGKFVMYKRAGQVLVLDSWGTKAPSASDFVFLTLLTTWNDKGRRTREYTTRFCCYSSNLSILSFVCAHLTAHQQKLQHRIADFHHIVGTLLFPALPFSADKSPTTMYSTSHLFFLGDLNFRIDLPKSHPMFENAWAHVSEALKESEARETLKEFDQLLLERRKHSIFVGFREGEFWQFKCTYKHRLGDVDQYE